MKKHIIHLLMAGGLIIGHAPRGQAQAISYKLNVLQNQPYNDLQGDQAYATDWDQNKEFSGNFTVSDFSFYGKKFDFTQQGNLISFGTGLVAGSEYMDSTVFVADGYLTPLQSNGSNSVMSFAVEGNMGSRILKFQWKNTAFTNSSVQTDYTNFQIWLYEGTSTIEYHYGPHHIAGTKPYASGTSGPEVGLFILSQKKADANKPPLGLWLCSGSPQSPRVVSTSTSVTLTGSPDSGTVYRYEYQGSSSGVQEAHENAIQVSLYPNPATGSVYLSASQNMDNAHITISNLSGQQVSSFTPGMLTAGKALNLDISKLSSGVYFVQLKGNNYSSVQKLIIP